MADVNVLEGVVTNATTTDRFLLFPDMYGKGNWLTLHVDLPGSTTATFVFECRARYQSALPWQPLGAQPMLLAAPVFGASTDGVWDFDARGLDIALRFTAMALGVAQFAYATA